MSTLTPLERYQSDLARKNFVRDPAQETAVKHLQCLYEKLIYQPQPQHGLFDRISFLIQSSEQVVAPLRGLYFWGGVGRGKTYLMDSFYEALPIQRKLRMHFHRFMYAVHDALKGLNGQHEPLKKVADQFADKARILCFDEFQVSDIADAMILGGLLAALFERGITLVATSNVKPVDLYKNGLQRAQFEPAIDLLIRHTEAVNVDGGRDYRLGLLQDTEIFYSPLDDAANDIMQKNFNRIATEPGKAMDTLMIHGRNIQSIHRADGIVWFDFREICDGPRGQSDYIEIARCFNTVLISDIPVFDYSLENQARRFISLVDEFYERKVKLIATAEKRPDELYQGKTLEFEFQRTVSRLQEMQSESYLASAHIP